MGIRAEIAHLAVPIDSLVPYARNPRRGNVDAIAESLRAHQQYRPLVVRKGTNEVLAGNHLLQAAIAEGLTSIAATFVECDDEEAARIVLVDNRSSDLAAYDDAVLVSLLRDLPDLGGTGYDQDALDELVATLATDAGLPIEDVEPEIDRAEELRQQYGVEPGQLWQLGEHRLLCGDSTDAACVARVLAGDRAHLCVTSPPYWVGKEYEREHTWAEVQAFIGALCAALAHRISHRIVINTGAPPAAHLTGERAHIRLLLDDYQRELAVHGFLLRYVRIWAKRGGLAHTAPQSDCIDQHWEFIGVFYNPLTYEGQRRCGESWATDGIWDDVPGTMSAYGHVAAFPIEIPARNVTLYTDPGALVLEPFSGSGTTVLACEQLGRKARAIEIDPGYVAVAIHRWEQATGETAICLS